MPFPPIDKTMEGLLKDTGERLTLVERRLAIGGGGGSSVPYDANAGMVVPYAGATAPTGWLLCDGAAISRAAYSQLFAAIGTAYGAGDGSTTFNLPNLKGRVPVGFDVADAGFDWLGRAGGEKAHTLTIAEMPGHSHSYRAAGLNALNSQPSNWDDIVGAGAASLGVGPSDLDNGASNAIQPRGGNAPHNNLQPYVVTNYIISTGEGVGGGGAHSSGGSTTAAVAGLVSPWAGTDTTVPSGWLLCDGRLVSRSTYAALFAAIGTTYGSGDGSTTFGLPNYKGRTLVGRDGAQTEFDVLGEVGGTKTHTHGAGSIRAAIGAIDGNTNTLGYRSTGVNGPGTTDAYTVQGSSVGGSHGFNHYTETYGDSAAASGLPPYAVANYIISTGSGGTGGGSAAPVGGMVARPPASVVVDQGSYSVQGHKVSFTSILNLSLNGVFSADYDEYVIEWRLSSNTNGGFLRLRSNGVDIATPIYGNQQVYNSSATAMNTRYDAVNGVLWMPIAGSDAKFTTKIDNPMKTGTKFFEHESATRVSAGMVNATNKASTDAAGQLCDGFTLASSGNLVSGWLRVYALT